MTKINEKFGITYPVPAFIIQDPQYKAISIKPKVILLYGYLILRSHPNPDSSIIVSTQEIIRHTGISINTVETGLKCLEDHGLIYRRDLDRRRVIYLTTFKQYADSVMKVV